jgi:hypothetical protein
MMFAHAHRGQDPGREMSHVKFLYRLNRCPI